MRPAFAGKRATVVIPFVLPQGATGTQACSTAARPRDPGGRIAEQCDLSAISYGTRYAKWAEGSRSQTHRRAAKGDFNQDDV